MRISILVNGATAVANVEPHHLLTDVLRDECGLTSVHAACEQGACGSCTVLLDGTAVRSCLLFAVQADGHEVTTVEGLGSAQQLHPVQEALAASHGVQCGFCTPGMVLAIVDLLRRTPRPNAAEVDAAMAGNICRCTGYVSIADAVQAVAAAGQAADEPASA